MPGVKRGKYRKYSNETLHAAVQKVLSGWTIYKTAKHYEIPYTTIKDALNVDPGTPGFAPERKLGKPFSLTCEEEQALVKYVIEMQELGFGLSATEVRKYAFQIAAQSGRKHAFNSKEELAGWKWWNNFKERYGLSMRLPENLSMARAAATVKESIAEFFTKLETVVAKHELNSKPHAIWNLDESGFTFVTKPGKIVALKGSKKIYQTTTAERGETITVLLTINATGQSGPCLIIFKGKKAVSDEMKAGAPPNAMVTVSKNGWINSEIFLSFLHHFAELLPPTRPVLILMDSHSSHISPEALRFAYDNKIIFLTFPSHTTHLLQPLDLSVFGPMKTLWKQKVKKILKESGYKPTRKDFLPAFSEVFQASATMKNICGGFTKSGIYPLNKEAIPEETFKVNSIVATTPLSTEQSPAPSESSLRSNETLLKSPPTTRSDVLKAILPQPIPIKGIRTRKSAAQQSRLFDTPPEFPSTSGMSKKRKTNPKSKANKVNQEMCSTCGEMYANDNSNGPWIQCLSCTAWYHESCQGLEDYDPNFICLMCEAHAHSDSD